MSKPTPQTCPQCGRGVCAGCKPQTLSFEEALYRLRPYALLCEQYDKANNLIGQCEQRMAEIRAAHQRELVEAREAHKVCVACEAPMLQHGWDVVNGMIHPLPCKVTIEAAKQEARRETWRAAAEAHRRWMRASGERRAWASTIHEDAAEEFERHAGEK